MRKTLFHITNNIHNRQTSMPQAVFKPAFPARERQQADALDGAVTGIGDVGGIDLRAVK
jgi:hypothetical protein